MQDDAVELVEREEAVPAHCRVLRGHGLERAVEVAGEDDVDDVLRAQRALGRDRVDERHRALDRRRLDAHLLAELAVERVDEALARLHAPAREQPHLPPALLVSAQEHAAVPAEDRRDPDARLAHHYSALEPKPRSPRSLSGSWSVLDEPQRRDGHDNELGDAHPRLDGERLVRSVFSSTTRTSPRYPESMIPGELTFPMPSREASPERGDDEPA